MGEPVPLVRTVCIGEMGPGIWITVGPLIMVRGGEARLERAIGENKPAALEDAAGWLPIVPSEGKRLPAECTGALAIRLSHRCADCRNIDGRPPWDWTDCCSRWASLALRGAKEANVLGSAQVTLGSREEGSRGANTSRPVIDE